MIWLNLSSVAISQTTSKRKDVSCGVIRVHRITRSLSGSPLATPCKNSTFVSDVESSSLPQAVNETGKDKAPKLANDF